MIRRGFWLVTGFGLGVAAATRARRRVEEVAARLVPADLATRMRRDVSGALDEGRREMQAREARLRHLLAAPDAGNGEGRADPEQ
jgi:hypothetical protein